MRLAASAAIASFVALGAQAATTAGAHSATIVDLVVRADELHVGDGTVLHDVAIAIDDGRIVEVAPADRLRAEGFAERHARFVLPGLVAAEVVPDEATDAPSIDPGRLAAEHLDPRLAEAWLDAGVTGLAVSPGSLRLVTGRGGLARVTDAGVETVLADGALCASLSPEALDPPLLFEPTLRPNVDNPLPPARPQRPFTPMAAIAELRRLVQTSPDFAVVRERRAPLRIHADRVEDIGRAIELQHELGFDLVVEGGAEAWKLADELAAAKAIVVLELLDPTLPAMIGRDMDVRSDAPALLDAAGVRLALSPATPSRHPDPLLLAAAAVRDGLPDARALAGITGLAAAAIGAPWSGIVMAGRSADLAAFDAPPLALRATPTFVVSHGVIVRERTVPEADKAPVALRAGRVLTPRGVLEHGFVLISGERIVSVGTSTALPEDAVIHDFGDDAVLTAGFIDAFGWLGQEPGSVPGGSSRLRAVDAVEPQHPSMARALRAGVTSALVVPGTRGVLLGSACSVGTRPKDDEKSAGKADVIATDAGFVFWVDEGPADEGVRTPRLKALKDFVQKAKGYHEQRVKAGNLKKGKENTGKGASDKDAKSSQKAHENLEKGEKSLEKGKEDSDAKETAPGRHSKPKKPDEPDPALEPLRALFEGRARCWVRAGRQDTMLEAIDALKSAGLQPVLAGAEEGDLVAAELAKRGVAVVLSPRTTRRDNGKVISVAAALRAAGVPVAMGSFGWGASDLLPLAASAAVRDGLSPDDALAAVTAMAAASAGIADAGMLEAGARADVVAWSGDPMEPASRVLGVVARGKLVEPMRREEVSQ